MERETLKPGNVAGLMARFDSVIADQRFCDDTTIDPMDANTWTFREDRLAGGYAVFTSWSPIRFAPFYGLTGKPSRHFETIVINKSMPSFIGDSQTYQTEAEARDGHAVMVSRLRTMVEAL